MLPPNPLDQVRARLTAAEKRIARLEAKVFPVPIASPTPAFAPIPSPISAIPPVAVPAPATHANSLSTPIDTSEKLPGPWLRFAKARAEYPAVQHTWTPGTKPRMKWATSGEPKVELYRNGALVDTKSRIHDLYFQIQSGDEVRIHSAVYGGHTDGSRDMLVCNKDLSGVRYIGIAKNGFYPRLKSSATYLSDNGSIVLFQGRDMTVEGIGIDIASSEINFPWLKAGVIFAGVTGTSTLKRCGVFGGDIKGVNGIFGAVGDTEAEMPGGDIIIEDNDIFECGGNNGPEHLIYINMPRNSAALTAKLTVRRNWFHTVRAGYHLKTRFLNNEVTDNYFMGTPNYKGYVEGGDSGLVDISGGGNFTIARNICTKSKSDGNQNVFLVGCDTSNTSKTAVTAHVSSYPNVKFRGAIRDNVIVAYSNIADQLGGADHPIILFFLPYVNGKDLLNGFRYPGDTATWYQNQEFEFSGNTIVGIDPYYGASDKPVVDLNFWRYIPGNLVLDASSGAVNLPGVDAGPPFTLKSSTSIQKTFDWNPL